MVATRFTALKPLPSSDTDLEHFATPGKTLPTLFRTSASSTPRRHLPTPRSISLRYVCSLCKMKKDQDCADSKAKSTDFDFLNYAEHMSNIIEEFNIKFVYISKQISNIDKSLSDHLTLVNSLKRDICMFAEVRVNRRPNDMPISTQTSPLTGLHARKPLSIDHLARTGSASAHPPSMSLRNRSHPSLSPLLKIGSFSPM